VRPAPEVVTGVGRRRLETPEDALGVVQQRTGDELVRGERDRLGRAFGELAARCGGDVRAG